MEWKDYYEVLGVNPAADEKQIQAQYRYKAFTLHPDKTRELPERIRKQAEEEFKRVNEAYEVLSDPEKRKAYDLERTKRRVYFSSPSSPESEPPTSPPNEAFRDIKLEETMSPSFTVPKWRAQRKWLILLAAMFLVGLIVELSGKKDLPTFPSPPVSPITTASPPVTPSPASTTRTAVPTSPVFSLKNDSPITVSKDYVVSIVNKSKVPVEVYRYEIHYEARRVGEHLKPAIISTGIISDKLTQLAYLQSLSIETEGSDVVSFIDAKFYIRTAGQEFVVEYP